MTPLSDVEAEALGRRWLAAGGGVCPGMIVRHDVEDVTHRMFGTTPMSDAWWPDLRDAATRGAALDVVRERWRAPALQVGPVVATEPDGVPTGIVTSWRYYVNDPEEHFGAAPTEPEALVAALEARHAL